MKTEHITHLLRKINEGDAKGAELLGLEQRIKELEAQIRQEQEQLQALLTKNENRQKQSDSENNQLKSEIKGLKTQVKKLKSELQTATASQKQSNSENNQLKSEIKRLKAQIKTLKANQKPKLPRPIQQLIDNMVYVESGYFDMGSNNGSSDEKPVHRVYMSSFKIAKYTVTQAQWQAVMDNNPSYFGGDNRPVENVSWEDVQVFIEKLNRLTAQNFRLPSEAQWEYAARGGQKTRNYTYAGSNSLEQVAWYGENSNSETHAVGQKRANELGLYDMSGNVWEWCQDWYDDSYYSSSSSSNPTGPSTGSCRVMRGGAWFNSADYCRTAYRYYFTPSYRYSYVGFRLIV